MVPMKNSARVIFQNNELLRYLDSAGLDRVSRLATRRSYDQGATIFAEGDPADAIYGVICGQVQISARTSGSEEIFLDSHGSGKIFGLISAIDGLPRCATARAAPAAEVFTICRDRFLQQVAADPLLSLGLLAVFCRRRRTATRLIVGEYAQRDIPARLAHRVLELTGVDEGGTSCLDITQAELAKFVFVSRQVVNQYLSEWHSRGWVSTSPRHLRVTDRQALAAVAASGYTN
jgi:CRP-like cAMP-binding protein